VPKPSLGDIIAAVPDPMLSDNYVFDIPNIPTGANSIPLRMQCQQAAKPGMTLETVDVQLFGHTTKHAGRLTFTHEMQVQYLENRRAQITSILEGWSEYARSHQSQHGAYKNEYARDGYLTVFDQKGQRVKEYRVVNLFPTQIPETQFDGTSSTVILLGATFTYDYYEERT
jgi:hypothetical protein